ncbi:MAG: AEC family transporter [Beijerinckiaceae bacterium]
MPTVAAIVLPIFVLIAAGFAAGRFGLAGGPLERWLNWYVYWIALPALLFKAMATTDLSLLYDGAFFAGFLGALTLLWALAMLAAKRLFRLTLQQGALHGMCGVYSNTGYMGIPLAIAAWGEAAALPAILATVVNTAFVVGAAIVMLESGADRKSGALRLGLSVTGKLLLNPMLMAPFAGLGWAAAGLPVPAAAVSALGAAGVTAGPCALFAIGLFLTGKPLTDGYREVGAMVAMKLLFHPLVTALFVLALFPSNPLWAKTAILMAALPTGTGSYVLAHAYRVYVLRTSSAILITTLGSMLTLAAFFAIFPPVR